MESTGAAIPSGAVPASILVLIYSAICLALTVLLSCMLVKNGEKYNYVTIFSVVVSVTSTASIAQQIYYACKWRDIRITALQQAKASADTPSIAYGPLSTGFNLAMFEIQFTGYMINSVLIMFWAMALTKGVFDVRHRSLMGREAYISGASKVFGVVVPGLLVGITFTDAVKHNEVAFMVVTNVLMIGALAIGSITMVALAIRYVYSRHLFASIQNSSSVTSSTPSGHIGQPQAAKIRVDKSLLSRFAIAFVIITAFEVSIISFEFMRRSNARAMREQNQPDFSLPSTISEILQFMPGVTAGLLCFLVFGTTGQFRKKYIEAFKSARFWRRRRSSSPSRPNHHGSMEVWNTLPSDAGHQGYMCTIRAGGSDVEDIELHGKSAHAGTKSGTAVTTQDEESRLAVRRSLSISRDSVDSQPQPWRSLGIHKP